MRAKCIQAVSNAVNRSITVAESRGIEQRIREAKSRIALRDPAAWQALSADDQLRQAAQEAAQELYAEAIKKQQRLVKAIQVQDKISNYLNDQVAKGFDDNKIDAINRINAAKGDAKDNITSVESLAKGIEAASMGKLVDTWQAISPKLMGLFARKDFENAFIREAHGIDTGIPEIKKAAKAWLDAVETLRERFNDAGGTIGKLDNWGLPHGWSQDLANKFGKDRWVADMLNLIDRKRYIKEDGNFYDDAEMKDFLDNAWLSIATNGANKQREIGAGKGIKANRNSESRQIHFKDGDAALEAFQKYSDKNLFEVLSSHVNGMARDIALIETWSPNADNVFANFLEMAHRESAVASPEKTNDFDSKKLDSVNLYNYVSGNTPSRHVNMLGAMFSATRSVLSASLLGSSPISAIADNGTLYLTAQVNKISKVNLFLNQLRGLNFTNQEEKVLAARAGLMVRQMADDVNRFSTDNLGPQWTNKMSSFMMRLSGQNKLDGLNRRAFGITVMDSIGSLTRKFDDISKLDKDDYKFLLSKGITADEWKIWTQAVPEHWGNNHTVLTPDSIYQIPGLSKLEKERAATKLLAVTLEEGNIAVIEPGARQRFDMAITPAGTVKGELLRSIYLFKSFPHAMVARHINRGLDAFESTQGKIGYIASLVALQTFFGAIALEINDIISGRDPRNLNPFSGENGSKNWIAALLKGGAFGVYADYLFNESKAGGRTIVETLAGPVAGLASAVDGAVRGNILKNFRDEETHYGADFARLLKGITPGSNLWYTKAATDHLIFNQLQEFFSPGYLARTQEKAERNSGTSYWWRPDDASGNSARMPNLSKPIGVSE